MRTLLYVAGLLLFLSSCGWLNPGIMLRTGHNYQYSKIPDSTKILDYKISPNDVLEFNIYSNDGFKLIDLTSLNGSSTGYRFQSTTQYLVESDGNIKLPILGLTKLSGYTIRDAENFLKEKYANFYVNPFVIISVSNKRVIIFPGSAGDAKVVPLINNNTTLIEALALAGGIADDGKAREVKLIRQNNDKHDVFLIDLSRMAGIKQASMVLQANDIIYVEPRKKYTSKFLSEIAPIVSLFTSAFVLFTYTSALTK